MVAFNTLDNGIFDLYEICMRTGFSHISFNQTVHCAARRNVCWLVDLTHWDQKVFYKIAHQFLSFNFFEKFCFNMRNYWKDQSISEISFELEMQLQQLVWPHCAWLDLIWTAAAGCSVHVAKILVTRCLTFQKTLPCISFSGDFFQENAHQNIELWKWEGKKLNRCHQNQKSNLGKSTFEFRKIPEFCLLKSIRF